MAISESSMSRWIEEVLSVSADLYNINIRAQKLRRKTASGGYFLEPAPSTHTGAPIGEIRNAFNLLVVDLTNFFDNADVGKSDRTSAYWQANRDAGI